MQLTAAATGAVLAVPGSMAALAPNPLVRYLDLPDAEPSTISVARRRDDDRPAVIAFAAQAAQTVARDVGLVPGGTAR
jgi:hypothetical protein